MRVMSEGTAIVKDVSEGGFQTLDINLTDHQISMQSVITPDGYEATAFVIFGPSDALLRSIADACEAELVRRSLAEAALTKIPAISRETE